MVERASRRDFIANAGTILGGTAMLLCTDQSLAQQERDHDGTRVWLGMTQAELDAAYSQGVYAPNRDLVLKRWQKQSEAALRRLREPDIFAYGPTPIEQLLVFRSTVANAPIHIFAHGGAWQDGRAIGSVYKAEPVVNAGAHAVLLDFASMNDEGIRLSDMARQVRNAVAWVYRNAARFGGDRERIYVSGHSSGAHLAGVILTTDWVQDYDLPADLIKGGLCSSGMFDLEPVRLSLRNDYLQLSDAEEERLSPQRQIRHLSSPVVIAYGTEETPEFQRQSRDFVAAVNKAGKPVTLHIGEAYNHFEIAETYANPYGFLGRLVLEQMQLV
jgi:arylformamidase